MSLKKAVECVRKSKSFLITTHTNLEGDALGSALAFWRLAKLLGKRAQVIIDDRIPYGYEFMPYASSARRFNRRMRRAQYDCFVAVDCSGLFRCGQVAGLVSPAKPILNIDHHISNEKFGCVNWINAQVSSTAEMMYQLYKAMRVSFDRDTATLLYTGMLTDTGSFHYTNTHWQTHATVANLLQYGVNVSKVHQSIYENIPFSDMEILSKILPGLQRDATGKIASFLVPARILAGRTVYFDLSDKLLSFARAIKGVEVALLFRESLKNKNEIRVNFRSQGNVDVNTIAMSFGGGGHRTASGATIRGNIHTVSRRVIRTVRQSIL